MSGHSKWATIKHRKGAADKARSKLFAKLIRAVEVAAREGGGDLDANATLRTMYQKARDNSVPLDTIERAIKRGTGELEGVSYESVSYEGYAPGGVAMYVEVLTDNRNRTGSEIRSLFSRAGGSLAEPGAVAWQFERQGLIVVAGEAAEGDEVVPVDEDTIMLAALDAGANDISGVEDVWHVSADAAETSAVRQALESAGMKVSSSEITYVAKNTVQVSETSEAKQVMAVLDALDDHDDVQGVYANFDMSDDLLEALAS